MVLLDGYHGTSLESAKEIIKSNYALSIGDREWLGDGVYFFVSGISSNPDKQAEQWAIVQSWDNNCKKQKYVEYCIIYSKIEVKDSEFLDLTTEEGVEILSYLADKYDEKLQSIGRKLRYSDGLLINLARNENIIPLEVVRGNFYIKFKKERKKNINLRTSNCTICSVFNPDKTIIENKLLKRGKV
ncbi:hypothetical protein EDL99_10795 [Ornithobacterium rhinotracheale]|uniref:hypothetical protein n=1 Tax=Ornithobacterium rhinotracheale TaxID=28251 RepID=UPI00129C4E77|nr:hypothetical protein [Ornithobacterium rhinotracheale]MRJ09341.1 hypothetical protein [Ornithobacterium rhinotracheale]UOH77029.1 hypothetical protein MT996_07315 [Ornithobacterium rhinotracheale]